MGGYLVSVEKNIGLVVDCAEMQDQTAVIKEIHLVNRKQTAVPEVIPRLQLAFHTRQDRFRRKRDENLPVVAVGEALFGLDSIVP